MMPRTILLSVTSGLRYWFPDMWGSIYASEGRQKKIYLEPMWSRKHSVETDFESCIFGLVTGFSPLGSLSDFGINCNEPKFLDIFKEGHHCLIFPSSANWTPSHPHCWSATNLYWSAPPGWALDRQIVGFLWVSSPAFSSVEEDNRFQCC